MPPRTEKSRFSRQFGARRQRRAPATARRRSISYYSEEGLIARFHIRFLAPATLQFNFKEVILNSGPTMSKEGS